MLTFTAPLLLLCFEIRNVKFLAQDATGRLFFVWLGLFFAVTVLVIVRQVSISFISDIELSRLVLIMHLFKHHLLWEEGRFFNINLIWDWLECKLNFEFQVFKDGIHFV